MACTSADLEKFSEIAKNEIGEASANLPESVRKVREIIAVKYKHLRLPPDADNLLERCLRNRKFDVDQAATQVHSFFKLLTDFCTKEMLLLPSIHKEYFFDSMGFGLLKQRDFKGRAVVCVDFEKLQVKNFALDKTLAMAVIFMDEMTRLSVDTQRVGMVFVVNMKEYAFGHAKQFTLSMIRVISKILQGAFPMRYKGFYIIETPPLFLYTWALLRPFLKNKIKSRVHTYGSDLTELYKHVSPDILPESLGGKLSYEEAVDLNFTNELAKKDDYFKELLKYGYMSLEKES